MSSTDELRARIADVPAGGSATLKLIGGRTFRLGGEQLVVAAGRSVRIESDGAILDGEERSRIFVVHGTLELTGVHLINGLVDEVDDPSIPVIAGGAMYVHPEGNATLVQTTIRDSKVIGSSGMSGAGGGAIANFGILWLDGCNISRCSAIYTGTAQGVTGGGVWTWSVDNFHANTTLVNTSVSGCWIESVSARHWRGRGGPIGHGV